MSEADDRILEAGLQVVLSERPSLADAVVSRWKAAGQGTAEPRRQRGERIGWKRASGLVAATVCAAIVLRTIVDRDTTLPSPVLAEAEAPVEVWRRGRAPSHQTELRAGDSVVVGPEASRDLLLVDGTRVRIRRCGLVSLEAGADRPRLVTGFGHVDVSTGSNPTVRIATPLGVVTPSPNSRLTVDLTSDGYDLREPERFRELAEEIHMKMHVAQVSTLVLLISGAAQLADASGTRDLGPQEAVGSKPADRSKIEAALMREVGRWKLEVTDMPAGAGKMRVSTGTEVCRRGPGGRWLVSDVTLQRGPRKISSHSVLGVLASGSLTGSFVDSFGGRIGLLSGKPSADLTGRTVEMRLDADTSGFRARMTMRWTGPDTRETSFEMHRDGAWVLARKILHRRITQPK